MLRRLTMALLLGGSLACLIAACAAPTSSSMQQPVARDAADRLFLKYVEIAQRASPTTEDDLLQLKARTDEIPTSGDPCSFKNFWMLTSADKLTDLIAVNTDADWTQHRADLRKELTQLQAMPLLGDGCVGRGFPQVQFD